MNGHVNVVQKLLDNRAKDIDDMAITIARGLKKELVVQKLEDAKAEKEPIQ